MDRLRTTLNVTGDSVVTGIVSSRVCKSDFDHLHDHDLEKPQPPDIIKKDLTHMVSEEDDSDPIAESAYKEPVMQDVSTGSSDEVQEVPAT